MKNKYKLKEKLKHLSFESLLPSSRSIHTALSFQRFSNNLWNFSTSPFFFFLFTPLRAHEINPATRASSVVRHWARQRDRFSFFSGKKKKKKLFACLPRVDGAQRWLPWPTGTDCRCKPGSSRPRATSQWPTDDLDRPCCTLTPPPPRFNYSFQLFPPST